MDKQDIKAMEIMRKVAGKFSKVDEIQAALASAYRLVVVFTFVFLLYSGWNGQVICLCFPFVGMT